MNGSPFFFRILNTLCWEMQHVSMRCTLINGQVCFIRVGGGVNYGCDGDGMCISIDDIRFFVLVLLFVDAVVEMDERSSTNALVAWVDVDLLDEDDEQHTTTVNVAPSSVGANVCIQPIAVNQRYLKIKTSFDDVSGELSIVVL
eukprot:m.60018 g.60018  ORF g.60018 m.60018 type:complete len:144 (+) comp7929_c0_seq8:1785-2216(+)